MFEDFDIENFWEKSDYADEEYTDNPFTAEKVATVEQVLGYKLPGAYIQFMKFQNGGIPRKRNHRTSEATSWSPDHVAIAGIYSIGSIRSSSLCGDLSSAFWIKEWGYPAIGVYFADCPSAGHDMLALDYSACGPAGEPTVVHVDQECGFKITFVARTFESFIRGLEDDQAFEKEG